MGRGSRIIQICLQCSHKYPYKKEERERERSDMEEDNERTQGSCLASFEEGRGHQPRSAAPELEEARKQGLPEPPEGVRSADTLVSAQ